jgi:hypothetical protein
MSVRMIPEVDALPYRNCEFCTDPKGLGGCRLFGKVCDGSPKGKLRSGGRRLQKAAELADQSDSELSLCLPSRRHRPTMLIPLMIIIALALTAALASVFAWPLVLLLYVTQLRSRKPRQRAQLARDLGISALALKDKNVVGFFHPFW